MEKKKKKVIAKTGLAKEVARILVVEDDPVLSKRLCMTVKQFGYQVVGCAQTGREAIQKSKILKPNLVLMDVVLKGDIDGIDAAKKIKELSIPIIFISAFADEERIARAKETDPFGYIVKPYKNEELKAVIELALQKRKSETMSLIHSEKEIHEIRKEIEHYLNLVGSMVITLNSRGDITLVNNKGCEILGYKREELIGRNWFKTCIPKEYRQEVESVFKKVVLGKMELVEYWENPIVRSDGEIRNISWHNSIQTDEIGKLIRVLSSGDDITERTKATLLLKESEQKYRSLFDNMQNSFALHKMIFNKFGKAIDYEFTEVNSTFENQTGLKRDNIIGRRATETIPGIKREPADWIGKYGKVAKSGQPIRFEEYSNVLEKWFSVYAYSPKKGYFATIFEDITEAKKNEIRYKTIFENTGTALCIIEADKTISLVNSIFAKLAGYSKEEIEGKMKWTQFVTPEYLKIMKKYHVERRRKEFEVPKSYEFDFINSRKEKRSVQLYIDMIPGTQKSVASLLDITEKKLANKKLEESEKKYRSITENAMEMIVVVQDGKFVLTNPRLHEVLGYNQEDVRQMKSFIDFVHPQDKQIVAERHQARLLGKKVPNVYSFRITSKKGDIIWVEINAAIIEWEGRPAVLVLMEDVTERIKRDEDLTKFKLGFEYSTQIIFTTDTDGKVEYVNPQFEKIYGYKKAEIIGKTPHLIKSETKDKTFYEDFWKKLLSKQSFNVEIVNKAKNGKLINIQAFISPILSNKSEINGFMAIQTDITKQVLAEKTLREKVEQMEFMGRTNLKRYKKMMELEKENKELKEKLRESCN